MCVKATVLREETGCGFVYTWVVNKEGKCYTQACLGESSCGYVALERCDGTARGVFGQSRNYRVGR